MKKTWKEFSRFHSHDIFYGCVNSEGVWFDSSELFNTAIHWCVMHGTGFDDRGIEDEVQWMVKVGRELGFSIVHSTMLRKMYEAGLIK
jgi:hypothetical protein